MNKINIFLEHVYDVCTQHGVSLERALSLAAEAGYSGLECDLWRLSDGSLKKAIEGSGLCTASVYGQYDFAHDTPQQSLEKIKRHLYSAAEFGAEKILAIPGFVRPEDDGDTFFSRTCEGLCELCRTAEQYNITVTAEDFDDVNSPCCTTEGLERLFRACGALRWTFDTGNFAYAAESAAEAYQRLKGRLSHVHVKDRSRTPSGEPKANIAGEIMYPCECGGGYVGAEALVKQVIADGYKGDFSAEHFGACDQLSCMRKSAENIKEWIEESV